MFAGATLNLAEYMRDRNGETEHEIQSKQQSRPAHQPKEQKPEIQEPEKRAPKTINQPSQNLVWMIAKKRGFNETTLHALLKEKWGLEPHVSMIPAEPKSILDAIVQYLSSLPEAK
jgi:hypothetical protein